MALARFDNEEYKNWQKVGQSLNILASGIRGFTQNAVTELHEELKRNIGAGECLSCKAKDIKCLGKKTWTVPCPKQICNKWLSKIVEEHRNPCQMGMHLDNCDVKMWPTEVWEVGKAFMNKGQKKNKKAEDFDVTALLSVMEDCTHVRAKVHTPNEASLPKQVKEVRNYTMHSATMALNHEKMEQDLTAMISLLELPQIAAFDEAKQAAKDIKEIQKVDLVVTSKEEKEAEVQVYKDLIHSLEQRFKDADDPGVCGLLHIPVDQSSSPPQEFKAYAASEEFVLPEGWSLPGEDSADVAKIAVEMLDFISQDKELADELEEDTLRLDATVREVMERLEVVEVTLVTHDNKIQRLQEQVSNMTVCNASAGNARNKALLQNFTQTRKLPLPQYHILADSASEGWKSKVEVDGQSFCSRNAYTRRTDADQDAAGVALEQLKVTSDAGQSPARNIGSPKSVSPVSPPAPTVLPAVSPSVENKKTVNEKLQAMGFKAVNYGNCKEQLDGGVKRFCAIAEFETRHMMIVEGLTSGEVAAKSAAARKVLEEYKIQSKSGNPEESLVNYSQDKDFKFPIYHILPVDHTVTAVGDGNKMDVLVLSRVIERGHRIRLVAPSWEKSKKEATESAARYILGLFGELEEVLGSSTSVSSSPAKIDLKRACASSPDVQKTKKTAQISSSPKSGNILFDEFVDAFKEANSHSNSNPTLEIDESGGEFEASIIVPGFHLVPHQKDNLYGSKREAEKMMAQFALQLLYPRADYSDLDRCKNILKEKYDQDRNRIMSIPEYDIQPTTTNPVKFIGSGIYLGHTFRSKRTTSKEKAVNEVCISAIKVTQMTSEKILRLFLSMNQISDPTIQYTVINDNHRVVVHIEKCKLVPKPAEEYPPKANKKDSEKQTAQYALSKLFPEKSNVAIERCKNDLQEEYQKRKLPVPKYESIPLEGGGFQSSVLLEKCEFDSCGQHADKVAALAEVVNRIVDIFT